MIEFVEAQFVTEDRCSLTQTIQNLQTLYYVCQSVENIEGDVVEVGVFRGGTAKFMMTCLPNKMFWLFDTFEGIPELDEGGYPIGGYRADMEEVEEFLPDSDFQLIKGIFPQSLEFDLNCPFSLVHLDTDIYQGTKDGLEYFWPRLSKGGSILVHDYDNGMCPGVKPACEEFLLSLECEYIAKEIITTVESPIYFLLTKPM